MLGVKSGHCSTEGHVLRLGENKKLTGLLSMLFRHAGGERVWSVVRVPTPDEEQARQMGRELQSLGQESTQRSTHNSKQQTLGQ